MPPVYWLHLVETILFLILNTIVVPHLLVCTLPLMVMWHNAHITRHWTADFLLDSTCTMVQTAKRHIQAISTTLSIFTTLGHDLPHNYFKLPPSNWATLENRCIFGHHAHGHHAIMSSNIPHDWKIFLVTTRIRTWEGRSLALCSTIWAILAGLCIPCVRPIIWLQPIQYLYCICLMFYTISTHALDTCVLFMIYHLYHTHWPIIWA